MSAPPLVGHRAAVASVRAALGSGRLHHAWLLAGPPGIGKARFADAFALRMLAEAAGPPVELPGLAVPPEHPVARLFHAGTHPDFRRLQRLPRDRTDGLARSITVDQVRGLLPMFAVTPALSPRRVIVIDAIDDLERAGANALLKALEEPPQGTIFLLVSHAPARLLPTIRSRCRLLGFASLDRADMTTVLRDALPEADADEIAALAAAAGGAPGTALRYAGLDVAALDQAFDRLIRDGDATGATGSALARGFVGKAAQARYEAFLERAPARIAHEAKRREGGAMAEAIGLWEEARALAGRAAALSLDQQATAFEMAGLLARLARTAPVAKR